MDSGCGVGRVAARTARRGTRGSQLNNTPPVSQPHLLPHDPANDIQPHRQTPHTTPYTTVRLSCAKDAGKAVNGGKSRRTGTETRVFGGMH